MDDKKIIVDETQGVIRYTHKYAPYDFGQKRCYRCGAKARIRRHEHPILGSVYDICCTNPDCGNASSRNYMYRHRAVEAWNNKPTIEDIFYDRLLSKIIDRLLG